MTLPGRNLFVERTYNDEGNDPCVKACSYLCDAASISGAVVLLCLLGLGGVLSPLDGIGPDELNLESLYNRIKRGMEVILATNPSVEGDTTCLYLSQKLEKLGATVTRLARGIPVGSDLEYMDELTLVRAMEGRTSI